MSDQKKFYTTTPIYYGNGVPHIGHFYSSTIANVIHLSQKIRGADARFTTGIDENSQKAVIEADKAEIPIMQYLDSMAEKHKEVWDYFAFDYTDFIRTTEKRHHTLVKDVLQSCFDAGDIYEGEYEGMYCVGCESFKKDDDLVFLNKTTHETFPITPKVIPSDNIIKVCPDHLKTPDTIKEKNYFFKLSKYQMWLEEFYIANPNFVNPNFRFNEVKAFVGRGLEDFSISRETNTFGIPLPFDQTQVTYVWFDALFNYYTSCKYSRGGDKNNEDFVDESDFWPADVHVVGKDIIRFHAIFWPAMLASYFKLGAREQGGIHFQQSDLQFLPKQILAGGFFTVDGQKMSKSLGNVIEPVEYASEYGKELLTLYILSAFPIGNDGDYNRDDAIKTFNAKLANNLGNLVNRVVVLSLKLPLSGILSQPLYNFLPWGRNEAAQKVRKGFENYDLKGVLDQVFRDLDTLNKFADETEPWKLIKTDEQKASEVLYTLAEGLRQVGLTLYPFFPEKMSEMFEKLGLVGYQEQLEAGKLEELLEKQETFKITEKGDALFQRINID
ncbi:methionine--tRNA ligase [Candidatus Gracilibacteria bacterium]|nr:methionine--tRNA ligase [Candidatus Gracilibacteria bacterium]